MRLTVKRSNGTLTVYDPVKIRSFKRVGDELMITMEDNREWAVNVEHGWEVTDD